MTRLGCAADRPPAVARLPTTVAMTVARIARLNCGTAGNLLSALRWPVVGGGWGWGHSWAVRAQNLCDDPLDLQMLLFMLYSLYLRNACDGEISFVTVRCWHCAALTVLSTASVLDVFRRTSGTNSCKTSCNCFCTYFVLFN